VEVFMTRPAVLCALVIVGWAGSAGWAGPQATAQQPPKVVKMQSMNVSDNLYLLSGGGGNTLALATDDAPIVLMAHEPDIFPRVPDRVALTVCGHTHGGQVRLIGYAPIVPSKFGDRYVYGHIVEEGRNLVVSGGLGCSGLPLRFGSPPEIVMIELSA